MRSLLRSVSLFAVLGSLGALTAASSGVVQAQDVMLDVDAPGSGAQIMDGQLINIGGWAVAPGGSITSVDVFLDNPGTGAPLGAASLGIARPDVAATLGRPEAGRSGYNFDWMPRSVPQGEHTLTVVARSSTGQIATQTVPISACGCGLRGSITNPIVVDHGSYGWELDTGGPGVWIERPNDMPPNGD